MKKCDLHGMRFEEGKTHLVEFFNSCILEGEREIQIIHGYHGHAFKDYIRSQEFINDMKEEGIYLIKRGSGKNPGITQFRLDIGDYDTRPTLILLGNSQFSRGMPKKRMNLEEAIMFFCNKL